MGSAMDREREPERRSLKRGDGDQSYLIWDGPGDDAPVLHFAHANGFNANTYRRMLAPLAERMTVIASDMRGHGQSTLRAEPDHQKSWHVYADDLLALLDALAPGRRILLAGHSMGGTASLLAAARRPGLVSGLTLIDPVILPRTVYWAMGWRRLAHLGARNFPLVKAALARRAVWPDRATMVKAYTGRGAFKTWPEPVIGDYVEGGTRPHAEGGVELSCAPAWEAANFAWHDHNVWPWMRHVTCPLVLMRGTVGSTCPAIIAGLIRRRLPQIKDRVVDGASHFLPMEFPAMVRGEIAALLDTVTD